MVSNYDIDLKVAEESWTYHGEKRWSANVKKKAGGVVEVNGMFSETMDEMRFFILLLYQLGYKIAC